MISWVFLILPEYLDENCADYQRDLNSMIARSAPHYCIQYHQYRFRERRYSKELIPQHPDDILDKFFYTVLQAVQETDCLKEYLITPAITASLTP